MDNKTLTFTYKNWRGEIGVRHISPHGIWFGKTQFHPTPQWFLSGFDYDKRSNRDFAVKDIQSFGEEA